jgi:hypothetical protein
MSEDTLETVIPEAEFLGVSPDVAEGPRITLAAAIGDGAVKDGEAMLKLVDAAATVAATYC